MEPDPDYTGAGKRHFFILQFWQTVPFIFQSHPFEDNFLESPEFSVKSQILSRESEFLMKSIILSLFSLSALLAGVSINSASAAYLTIYTYESFNSEWGPGPVVFKNFEEQCGCKIKIVLLGILEPY